MTLTGIALIIIAASICILVLTLIPAILTIRRTATSVGALADMVQQELKPAIRELATALAELRAAGCGVAEYNEDLKCFMSALGEAGENLHTINRTVGAVTGVLNKTSVWATGARVAGKYLVERYLKKRGGTDHV